MTIKGLMSIICGYNIVLVVIAVILIFTLNTRFHDMTDAADTRYQSYLLADELRQSSDDLTRLGRTYAITGDDKYEKMYMDILAIRNGKKPRPEEYHKIYWDLVLNYGDQPKPNDQTVSLKSLMEKLHFSEAEFRLLSEAQGNSDALVGLEVKAMNAVKGNFADSAGNYTVRGEPDFKMARELLHSNTYHSEKAKIMKPIDKFFGELEHRTQGHLDETKESVETLVNSMTAILLLMMVSAFVSFFIIQQRVNQRIKGLADRLHEIGKNADLTVTMSARQNDEVGYIADNVGIMLTNFRNAITKIHNVSTSIQDNSSTIFDFIHSGHSLSNEQKSETNMAAAAIEEMTAALSEVAHNTSEADNYTKETDQYANKGKQVVSETIRQIQDLTQEFEETSTVVNELADESNKVSSVLVVIKSIAEQTNLLALNAAIEAARAGEQGRGFAVVADEVRSLAQKTQESTQEIEEMIDNLQQKSSAAVTSIQSGAMRLTETTDAAEQADAALINIVDSMQKLADLTSAIAAATEQQTTVSAEISKNIININEGSDRIAEGFGSLTDSANNLKTASDEMVESVSIFKV